MPWTAAVVGTSAFGRTEATSAFRLLEPAKVKVTFSFGGEIIRFLGIDVGTKASGGWIEGPGGRVWSEGSGRTGHSGSTELLLRPGDYRIVVSADAGQKAQITVDVIPPPPPPPPPAAPVSARTAGLSLAPKTTAGKVALGAGVALVILLAVGWLARRRRR